MCHANVVGMEFWSLEGWQVEIRKVRSFMRVVLFDLDGTLLLTNGGGKRALKLAMQHEFGLAEACVDLDFAGRTDRSLFEELLLRNGLPGCAASRARLRERYLACFPAMLHEHGGRVLPGAIEVLEELHKRSDLACYVMTGNLRETAHHKLRFFGLHGYFRHVFGGDHDAHRNDLAHRTADSIRRLDGENAASDMIVIGDTPADIRCGHAVGARVIAVCSGRFGRRELAAEKPMSVHDDLTGVAEIVRLITTRLQDGSRSDDCFET